MLWSGSCVACGKMELTWRAHLFCANFANPVGVWRPCHQAWCPGCYISDNSETFHVYQSDAGGELDDQDLDRMANVWRATKEDAMKFHEARTGDHFMIPFECDLCVFRKLYFRDPRVDHATDRKALATIRRMILDAFWSRASSTVRANAKMIQKGCDLSASLGLDPPYLEPGPLPSFDHCGYGVAMQMLVASQEPGRYSTLYKQFDTIRRLKTAFGNQIRASAQANCVVTALGDSDGKSYQRICSDPCASIWFGRFVTGCRRRMGQDWRPDEAISPRLIKALVRLLSDKLANAGSLGQASHWATSRALFVFLYVFSLRGNEGLLTDLKGLREEYEAGRTHDPPFSTLALLGQFKGEQHRRQHLMYAVDVTSSGIEVRKTISDLILVRHAQNFVDGPAICNEQGVQCTTAQANEVFHELLCLLYNTDPNLFPSHIGSHADVMTKYHVYRSFRRASDSRALAKGVALADIRVVNRWQKVEKAKGQRPSFDMPQHYAQLDLLVECFLRYTMSM